MAIHVPIFTPGEIIDATRKCLADNHVPDTIPIPIEEIVDVAYRIDLVPTPRLEERFSTVAFITHDLREIRVDEFVFNRQPYRLRFSLAHELGHLILHRDVYQQLNFHSPEQWKQVMADLGQSNYRRLEAQADRFARSILVPTAHLHYQFSRIADALAGAEKTFKSLPDPAQEYAVKGLAKTFSVSSGTIWFRLRDENLL